MEGVDVIKQEEAAYSEYRSALLVKLWKNIIARAE